MVASVLSGNRNFEGRINPEVRANYLMSPPLVVAFALVGRIDVDLRGRAARHRERTASPFSSKTSGRPRAKWPRRWRAQSRRRCSPRSTARSSRATSTGVRSTCPRARRSRGIALRRTSSTRLTSSTCRRRRSASKTFTARACSPCSATASPPTTSRPRARSKRTARPANTSSKTASSPRTSIRTAHAAATTKSWCAARSPTCA